MIRPTSHWNQVANVPRVTGDRACGFPLGLRGAQCATEQSRVANVPGVTGDSVRHFVTGLSGAPLLKTSPESDQFSF